MARYWVYLGDKVQGPVDIPSLRKVPGFNLLTQVCLEGEESWRIADEVIEIKSYFLSPPRLQPMSFDAGNAAPKLEMPRPNVEELVLPEPNTSWQAGAPAVNAGGPKFEIVSAEGVKKADAPIPASGNALRAVCAVCGYKNPRDVNACMKCGETLQGAPAAAKPTESAPKPFENVTLPTAAPVAVPSAAPAAAPAASTPALPPNTMVEIPLTKIISAIAIAAIVSGGSFYGIRSWKKSHRPKGYVAKPVQVVNEKDPETPPAPSRKIKKTAARKTQASVAALPGVPKPPKAAAAEVQHHEPVAQAADYRVVTEATPLKKRFSSPIQSPYAQKRRANASLWNAQEEQAIRQVQQHRIYGGQRTLQRNVDVLQQILRDREYTTAFESGKRIYLYNDMDWSADMKEGPVYEVRLTFSGGRESDGSPKKPLHFAFASDLERGTVEAGNQGQLRSNTLHAFFDESRIPPEERRAIAKDTEELVLASQPGASPLAMDTVVRQFAKVYTTAALSRVADAYDLTLVKKKLTHDTRLGSDFIGESIASAEIAKTSLPGLTPVATSGATGTANVQEDASKSKKYKSSESLAPSRGGPVDFRMERGSGKERTFVVRAGSKASVNKIWEVLTGYDRLKQFMPDMLTSEREGQDGAAIIVHTVSLTRYMVFVFKMNLHLRVIERPREHSLDFERIAGDFQSLRGSVEVTMDPVTKDSVITFRGTVVPTGTTMNMKLEKMARRLLIPQMDALRAKAESL